MKQKINSLLMLAFLAVFAISCSQSEDLSPAEQLPETRADSPMLMAAPTEVYFNDVEVGATTNETVNIKIAGLPSIGALTSFDCVLQGPDTDQFSFEDPQLGLAELFGALLGNGTDISVSYSPTEAGPHEAELLVTTSLLGLLMPLQITIPLHGSTTSDSFTVQVTYEGTVILAVAPNGENTSIRVIRQAVATQLGVDSQNIALDYQSTILLDSRTLGYYGITDGANITATLD
ncbi:MAG: ubiquitin family protein [Bacteroides sp.]|nr:ubiquitin family protein [Bacteroides sp.]